MGVKRADGRGVDEPQMKDIISANDIMIGHAVSHIIGLENLILNIVSLPLLTHMFEGDRHTFDRK